VDISPNEGYILTADYQKDSYWGFIAKNGYLYFNKALNEEVEEDFFTIYKIKVVF